MNWQNLNWKLLVAGFAATLIVLFVGHYLWQRTAVERPLIQVLLQDEAVKSAEFYADGKNSSVQVELTAVEYLGNTARRVSGIINKMQPSVGIINYVDNSNPYLEDLYAGLHFAVYEASIKGNFIDLNSSFTSTVQEAELSSSRLEVDQQAIYIQLHQGDAYLYRVVRLEVSK